MQLLSPCGLSDFLTAPVILFYPAKLTILRWKYALYCGKMYSIPAINANLFVTVAIEFNANKANLYNMKEGK